VATEENGFLEYLQLQIGRTDLVTKSELIAHVRDAGYSLSDRQLTFYTTEGLVPRSVRVGSRAGAYPSIVVELMLWIIGARDAGVPLEVLRELLPVWKFLVRARNEHELNLSELEYVARQHVTSIEGSFVIPLLITEVIKQHSCVECLGKVSLVLKDGSRKFLRDGEATIGFAIARTPDEDADTDGHPRWVASTRITLAVTMDHSSNPSTVILGLKPNAALPPDPVSGEASVPTGAEEVQDVTGDSIKLS
jgi:DNA-binding transcriptional MerR regulator